MPGFDFGSAPVGGLSSFLGGPIPGLVGGLLSGLFGAGQTGQARDDIQGLAEFNPFSGTIQGAGNFGPGGFQQDPGLAAAGQGIQGMLPFLQGGGFANDPSLQAALQQGGGIAGANSAATSALGQQANPFFNQASFANNMQNIGGLGNIFANNVARGPQDQTGGAFGASLAGGIGNTFRAGNTSGLVQQNLDASRALAQPFEQDLVNQFANREFSATRGATTGAANRQFGLQNSLLQADQQRILNAQGLGLQSQQQLGQLGLGQLGAANQFGQLNQGAFGQQIGAAQGFSQLGAGLEGQGFQQMLASLSQNQSAGNQRLQNALSLFNTQTGAFGQAFGQGVQGLEGLLGIGELGLQGQLGFLNAEANRIGATGLHAGALADNAASSSGFLGGLF